MKKEANTACPIRRINLSLPIVQTDSYEIYDVGSPTSTRNLPNGRPNTRQRPLIDHHKRNANLAAATRPSNRPKNWPVPVLINLIVDMPAVATDSSSTMADAISHALINTGYSENTLRAVPNMSRRARRPVAKDEHGHSRSTSGDRLLYESLDSFDDLNIHKTTNNMWQNIHHPQLSTLKVIQSKRTPNRPLGFQGLQSKAVNASSFENRSRELLVSANEHLQERIEQLTRNHFPSIQQLRHSHPCPELLTNRMHLHREEKRDFVPLLTRPRAVR